MKADPEIRHCPHCGSDQITRRPRRGSLYRCEGCRVVFILAYIRQMKALSTKEKS